MDLDSDTISRLVIRAKEGDVESFGALVEGLQDRLRGYVARFLFDREDVHDLVQDTLVECWRCIATFDTARPFWPWLRAIAHNRVLLHFRDCRRHRPAHLLRIDEAVFELAAPGQRRDDDDDGPLLAALRYCLTKLPQRQRDLIKDRFTLGRPVAEIALGLRASAASISMRLHRIRLGLASCMRRRLAEGGRDG